MGRGSSRGVNPRSSPFAITSAPVGSDSIRIRVEVGVAGCGEAIAGLLGAPLKPGIVGNTTGVTVAIVGVGRLEM